MVGEDFVITYGMKRRWLVSNPKIESEQVVSKVTTTEIAPTILKLLDLNPWALQAVREEHTQLLPNIELK